MLSSGFLVEINGYVLSEGVFLSLTLGGLLLLLRWMERDEEQSGDGWWLLVMAGGLAAASVLTRFVGLALVGTGAVAIALIDRRRSWWRAGLYAAIGGLPLTWAGSGTRAPNGYQALAGRTLALHFPSAAKLGTGLVNVATWVVPERAAAHVSWGLMELIGALLLAGLVAVVVLLGRRPSRTRRSRRRCRTPSAGAGRHRPRRPAAAHRVLAVFIVLYLAVGVGDDLAARHRHPPRSPPPPAGLRRRTDPRRRRRRPDVGELAVAGPSAVAGLALFACSWPPTGSAPPARSPRLVEPGSATRRPRGGALRWWPPCATCRRRSTSIRMPPASGCFQLTGCRQPHLPAAPVRQRRRPQPPLS